MADSDAAWLATGAMRASQDCDWLMITEYQWQQMAARLDRTKGARADSEAEAEVESALHEQIIGECRRRGWLALHGSTAHRSRRTIGEPDYVIAIPGGVLFVECKTRTGKVSIAQAAIHAWLRKLGHTVHVVRSLQQFLEVCDGAKV